MDTRHSGKQTSLGQPEEGPHAHEPRKVLDEAEAHGDDAPGAGQEREPHPRRDLLQDQIAGHLAAKKKERIRVSVFRLPRGRGQDVIKAALSPEDVARVEDGQPHVVLVVGDVYVILEAVQSRIANVGAVEERAQEE